MPRAPRQPKYLARERTGAKDAECESCCRYPRGSRNRAKGIPFRGKRLLVSDFTGQTFAAAKCVLRVLHKVRPVGFHAFRRFLLTWLRKNGTPRDLEHYWMGHAAEEVGDLYSKLKDDVAFRQEWAERIGLGFDLVHIGPQNEMNAETKKVA